MDLSCFLLCQEAGFLEVFLPSSSVTMGLQSPGSPGHPHAGQYPILTVTRTLQCVFPAPCTI